jgi:hypothetical protein
LSPSSPFIIMSCFEDDRGGHLPCHSSTTVRPPSINNPQNLMPASSKLTSTSIRKARPPLSSRKSSTRMIIYLNNHIQTWKRTKRTRLIWNLLVSLFFVYVVLLAVIRPPHVLIVCCCHLNQTV